MQMIPPNYLNTIPLEIRHKIFDYLKLRDLSQTVLVSRSLETISKEHIVKCLEKSFLIYPRSKYVFSQISSKYLLCFRDFLSHNHDATQILNFSDSINSFYIPKIMTICPNTRILIIKGILNRYILNEITKVIKPNHKWTLGLQEVKLYSMYPDKEILLRTLLKFPNLKCLRFGRLNKSGRRLFSNLLYEAKKEIDYLTNELIDKKIQFNLQSLRMYESSIDESTLGKLPQVFPKLKEIIFTEPLGRSNISSNAMTRFLNKNPQIQSIEINYNKFKHLKTQFPNIKKVSSPNLLSINSLIESIKKYPNLEECIINTYNTFTTQTFLRVFKKIVQICPNLKYIEIHCPLTISTIQEIKTCTNANYPSVCLVFKKRIILSPGE